MKIKRGLLSVILLLSGCAQITHYEDVIKTPPPASLVGNWQTLGPQRGLVDERATGSLIIGAQGDTLDCRQWLRVIVRPGKLTLQDDVWVNVTRQLRVMPVKLAAGRLYYDGLVLQKVTAPAPACQQALVAEDTLAGGNNPVSHPHRSSIRSER